MKVYPSAPGLVVRDPVKRDVLPADGREVEPSTYWRKRVLTGDVVTERPAFLAVEASTEADATVTDAPTESAAADASDESASEVSA